MLVRGIGSLGFQAVIDRRAGSAGLTQHLLAQPGIEADVHAAALLIDQLVELQPAVTDGLGGLQVGEAVDMEIGGVAQGVG